MKIAFHTNAFLWAGITDLQKIADFAVENGYTALEVGPGFPQDAHLFSEIQKKIDISNFIYARNFIDDNVVNAKKETLELFSKMRFASSLNIQNFVISTGISRKLSVPETGGMDPMASLPPVIDFLNEALDLAYKLNLNLLMENCPMYRNIATSPLMWKEIFDRIKSDRLGLCYDASHFVWQMIDVYAPIAEFGDKIKHIHLKDTLLDRKLISRIGILHNVGKERGLYPNQWWRHTIIGGGEINWTRFKEELDAINYQGNLSFEMEDYQYELNPQKVSQGLRLQRQYLRENWSV